MITGPEGSAVSLAVKYVLFFVNFTVFLVSGVVVGLMVWLLVLKEKAVSDVGDFVFDLACILCLAGGIAVVISFFGWFGSLRENVLVLKIYIGLMSFFFFVQVAAIVFLFVLVYAPDVPQQMGIYPQNALSDAIVKYRDDPDMQDLIDGLQSELKCCGISNDDEGYKDWSKNEYFNCSQPLTGEACFVPFSCCKISDGDLINYMCGRGMQNPDVTDEVRRSTIYVRGCFKALTEILNSNVLVVGAVTIGILLPQMFMTCLGRQLKDQIKKQKAKWDRN